MLVSTPCVSLRRDQVVPTARFTSDTGAFTDLDVFLAAPRGLLGRVDTTATPFLPVATMVAAVAGEDLRIESPVDPTALAGARVNAALFAPWWNWRVPAIDATTLPLGPARPNDDDAEPRGHGLFFTRGVDSWTSFLTLRDDPPAEPGERPATHLLTVHGPHRHRTDTTLARIDAGNHAAAAAAGLPLVDLSTNVRDLTDELADWNFVHGAVLASCGLLLSPLLDRATIASTWKRSDGVTWGSGPDLDPGWSSSRQQIAHHLPDTGRVAKLAVLGRWQPALDHLLVCWAGHGSVNCGRCPKCLRTLTGFHVVGLLPRVQHVFAAELTPDAVRYADEADYHPFVLDLLDHLPPDDELRAAWRRHLPRPVRVRRLVAPASTGVAGASLVARVDAALEHLARSGTDVQADPADDGPDLEIGWDPGMTPLRPAVGAHRRLWAAVATHDERTTPWIVAQPADPRVVGDTGPAGVADAAEAAWGPGLCYLPGIGWGTDQRPALGSESVGRLLRTARIRAWWTHHGTLDPLLVLESLEHGCLPLQVMPADQVTATRAALPAALRPVVVGVHDLTAIDPGATTALLRQVADHVCTGAAERDLSGDAARWPTAVS